MTEKRKNVAASVRQRLLNPARVDYPQLPDIGAPRVLGYPPEATLAEKLQAIAELARPAFEVARRQREIKESS